MYLSYFILFFYLFVKIELKLILFLCIILIYFEFISQSLSMKLFGYVPGSLMSCLYQIQIVLISILCNYFTY
jgi:hypothetical protein